MLIYLIIYVIFTAGWCGVNLKLDDQVLYGTGKFIVAALWPLWVPIGFAAGIIVLFGLAVLLPIGGLFRLFT